MIYKTYLAKVLFFLAISHVGYAEPPRQMPDEFYEEFTLHGRIPVVDAYCDDTYSFHEPLVYSKWALNDSIYLAGERITRYYGLTDAYLYEILDRHASFIKGKAVGIIGSVIPWYEGMILKYGGHPVTLDYNRIISRDPRLKTMTVVEYEQNPIQFDVLLSISSTEHDGLGRFGDPINPRGDIESMQKFKKMLKKNGILILSVPTGDDIVYWNAHRVYGNIRFPMLIEGWNLVDSCGPFGGIYEPIFVLKPKQ